MTILAEAEAGWAQVSPPDDLSSYQSMHDNFCPTKAHGPQQLTFQLQPLTRCRCRMVVGRGSCRGTTS